MTLQEAVESQFKFVLRNGAGDLNISGKSLKVILIDPPITEGSQRRGRQKSIKRAIVGVLKSELPNIPAPGTIATLDNWRCAVTEEGIE